MKQAAGCAHCGYDRFPAALVWHHVKHKNFSIGANYDWPMLLQEMQHCIVLCQNCHALVHADKEKMFSTYYRTGKPPSVS